MGIRFSCPNGHKLNVKTHLAGKRAICPQCGSKVVVPDVPSDQAADTPPAGGMPESPFSSASPSVGRPQQDTASPSVAIAVAQNDAAAPAPEEGAKPVPVAPTPSDAAPPHSVQNRTAPLSQRAEQSTTSAQLPESILPDSIISAPVRPDAAAAPVVATAEEEYNLRLERGRRNQILVALGLFVVVVALAATLIWVLRRDASQPDTAPAKPAATTTSAKFAPSKEILAVDEIKLCRVASA